MKKLNKKGFTIVELVIVIAVIGILAGVLIPTFVGIVDDANEKAAVADANTIYSQLLIANDGDVVKDTPEGKVALYIVTGPTNTEYVFKLENGRLVKDTVAFADIAKSAAEAEAGEDYYTADSVYANAYLYAGTK